MISLKKTKSEMKLRDTLAKEVPTLSESNYPWGLQIDLQQDSLSKLDMDVADYKVGDVLFFRVRTEVRAVSINDSYSGKSESMSLQITDMGLGED